MEEDPQNFMKSVFLSSGPLLSIGVSTIPQSGWLLRHLRANPSVSLDKNKILNCVKIVSSVTLT